MASLKRLPLKIEVHRNWTYEHLDQYQHKIADQIRGGGEGVILLSELAPVITVGRRTAPTDILLDEPSLRSQGISIYPVERGGFATYHGPGQWVLFVVESLERLTGDPRGVRKAVDGLLLLAQKAVATFGVQTEIRQGAELGLWTSKGKIAALGIQIQKGVVLHGISVNGYKTPQSFQGLKPCGLDLPVDYVFAAEDSGDGSGETRHQKFEELGKALIEAARSGF